MSDNPQVTPAALAAALTPAPQAAGQPEPAAPAATPAPASTGIESLPESWQKEIRDLRSEGQDKGARIAALETELAAARGEVTAAAANLASREEALTAQVQGVSLDLARYRAAIAAGIPADQADDFASRLRGNTVEEITADAQTLAGLVQAQVHARRGFDPSQGAGGGGTENASVATQLHSAIAALANKH